MRTAFRLTVALCFSTLPGCQSLNMGLLGFGPDFPEATPMDPVREIVCLWEPGEGIGLDGLPTRGFAGQILFFTGGHAEPAKVDGDVRIYVFDNHGTPEEQQRPIHQFDFDGGSWNTYLHDTNMGAAYQVFIPYTRKGGYGADCALRVRLTPKDGLPVFSKMATIQLQGRAFPGDTTTSADAAPPAADVAPTVNTDNEESGAAHLPQTADLSMQIEAARITNRLPSSLSPQHPTLPNTRGLDAAIADLLRTSETAESEPLESEADSLEAGELETSDDVGAVPPDGPPTGRYRLSARQESDGE